MRWGLVDSITALEKGKRATGLRTWDPSLPLFLDHFPGFPVVPGVLTLESLAQLAGKLIGYSVRKDRGDWPFPILSMMDKVKFRRFIPPATPCVLEAEIVELRDESAIVDVRALVEDKWRARAQQVFVFNAVPLRDPVEQDRVEALERSELARLWADYPGDF
ncbi:MAG: 3-hydroxyacyl-(acyl-carrier-protein) dehydratase [Pseudomonadota bacterium]|jgi:3-hydroxyacyl-[acyl-carrier-protein] dehydratase